MIEFVVKTIINSSWQGEHEIGNKYKAGTGRAMEDQQPSSDGERRKRSTYLKKPEHTNLTSENTQTDIVREKRSFHPKFGPEAAVNSGTIFRSKRQTVGQQMPSGIPGNSETFFDRIKQTFDRVMETAKQMYTQVRQSMGGGQQGTQSPKAPSNVENFQ